MQCWGFGLGVVGHRRDVCVRSMHTAYMFSSLSFAPPEAHGLGEGGNEQAVPPVSRGPPSGQRPKAGRVTVSPDQFPGVGIPDPLPLPSGSNVGSFTLLSVHASGVARNLLGAGGGRERG